MLRVIITLFLLIFSFGLFSQTNGVSINNTGNNPDPSAMLDIQSPDKGMLTPRMDSTGRKAISNPADGLMVYDTTTISFWYYDNDQWNEIRNTTKQIGPRDLLGNIPESGGDCASIKGDLSVGSEPAGVAVSGEFAYIIEQGIGEFKVIDISNPRNPSLVRSFSMTNPHGLGIENGTLFIADGSAGLRIFDASNPEEAGKNEIAHLQGMDGYDVILNEGLLIMVGKDGIAQYDYNNIDEIRSLSTIPVVSE